MEKKKVIKFCLFEFSTETSFHQRTRNTRMSLWAVAVKSSFSIVHKHFLMTSKFLIFTILLIVAQIATTDHVRRKSKSDSSILHSLIYSEHSFFSHWLPPRYCICRILLLTFRAGFHTKNLSSQILENQVN
jgi:hypothetical protein